MTSEFDESWGVWDTISGGYVGAVAARAMAARSNTPIPFR